MHRSGTSVTAKLAISQNKKIFALPHEIWDSHGIGTNRLIKNGAILVMNTEDILFEFKGLRKMYKKYRDIQKIDLNSLNIQDVYSKIDGMCLDKMNNTLQIEIKKYVRKEEEVILVDSLVSEINKNNNALVRKVKL